MPLAFVENGSISQYPIGVVDVKRRFPSTSFATPLEGQDLSSFGVAEVVSTDQPTIDTTTEKLEEGTPAFDGGTWRQVWNVIELSTQERQAIQDNKAAAVRADRNTRLADCDWTQLSDCPLSDADKAAWATYRSELRNVPEQSGFPWDVTWPSQP